MVGIGGINRCRIPREGTNEMMHDDSLLIILLSLVNLAWGILLVDVFKRKAPLKWLYIIQLATTMMYETVWILAFLDAVTLTLTYVHSCMVMVCMVWGIGLFIELYHLVRHWKYRANHLYLPAIGVSLFQLFALFGVFLIVESWVHC